MAVSADGMEPVEVPWCSCFSDFYDEKRAKSKSALLVPVSPNCPRHNGTGEVVAVKAGKPQKPAQSAQDLPEAQEPAEPAPEPQKPAQALADEAIARHVGRRGRKPKVSPTFDEPPSAANFYHASHAKDCPGCLDEMRI